MVQSVTNVDILVDTLHADFDDVVSSESYVMNKDDSYSLWHHRLGHALISKLKHIEGICANDKDSVCITCPMAKIFKLPF